MATATANGLSLWLMPEGDARARLSGWIDRLAVRFGTERFPPHLTLLSGLLAREEAAAAALGELAAGLAPFTVRLDSVDGRDERFLCLFVRAVPGPALHAAHAAAARAFDREPEAGYLPHVSLVYGRLGPQQKVEVTREVRSDVSVRFEANRVHLWRTQGPVVDWCEIGSFALGR